MTRSIKRYSIGLLTLLIFTAGPSSAQLVSFYGSPNYSTFINNLISNSIWNSSMEKYTKQYKGSSSRTGPDSAARSVPEEIPEYRRYRAVQFKSTGTVLTLQEYLDAVQIGSEEKVELKTLILKIFKEYEEAAVAKGYPNDWALAYVSFVGLHTHIYYGKTEKPLIPFEQNIGLRDVVAEYATDNDLFNNVTDQQKQELYELLVMLGGLTYHYYEKACRENNLEEIENCKLSAQQHLSIVGIRLQ